LGPIGPEPDQAENEPRKREAARKRNVERVGRKSAILLFAEHLDADRNRQYRGLWGQIVSRQFLTYAGVAHPSFKGKSLRGLPDANGRT
jgi:hypothetical protein